MRNDETWEFRPPGPQSEGTGLTHLQVCCGIKSFEARGWSNWLCAQEVSRGPTVRGHVAKILRENIFSMGEGVERAV